MALDTTASASEDRERDQRIQSAKKKLKSYRAKQALLSKRTSGSRQLTSAQAKRISASDPTSAVANAVQDTILAATEQAQQDQTSHESAKRHSRSVSRAGHGRGHSRAGSISVTADRMALATGDALRNSFLAQEQLTQQQQQQQASTDGSSPSTHVVHTRQHSRQHSRSASRRLSFAGGFPSSSSNATILAVEHGPDSFGPAGKPTDWADLPSKVEPRATASHSPLATPRASTRPLSGMATADALFASPNDDAVAAHTTDAAPSARRLSRHTRKTSLATKRESMELMGGLGFPAISVSQDAGLHRLGSQPSASARRASRRISGTNRLSGLQSASVLFGVPDRRSATGKDFDWRGALDQWQSDDVAPSQDDVGGVDDRRTALEKLEGRGAVQAPSVGGPSAADRSSLSASKRHSRSHSRQSSVQLPSFDDIHGQDGMNKRSSVNLLERNERSTLEERDVSGPQRSPASPWLGIPSSSSLGNLSSPSLGSIASLSHSQSSPDLSSSRSPKARPTSLFVAPEAQQPEGLGTLMEEEEEEDVTSPIKERKQPTFDSLLDDAGEVEDEEAQRRRREEERETIKRTRRSSLQPRPLKLKSRPASLFVSPAMQMKANMLLNSPSKPAPQADDIEGIRTADGLLESPRRDIAAGWSFSAAQDKAQARAGDADCENSPAASNTPTRQTPARRSLLLGNVTSIGNDGTDASTEESSPPSPTNGPKHGMRALRLGSGSISGATDSGSSTPTTTLAQRRQSYIAASQSGSSISERSFGLPSSVSANSMRRSSIIYKPSQDSSTSSSVNSAYEELKAKSVRDVATVEEQRRQIEKLTIELSSESQRASHEYAQLEQWSAEERQKLVSRVDQLQVELTQARQDLAEKEAALADDAEKLAAKERQSAEQLEDLQAERDMLQDDVDGWRTRCGDLEKTVQSHKASVEEVEQQKYLLALKVQGLEKRLKEEGIEVVTTPTAEDVAARQLGIPADLASALRSPALSFNTPSVSTPSGYFSPRAAPADAIPPPQAVQLLKDMRQQIFNLAGSLEHQRKEQLKYQEEAQSLQKQNDELRAALEQVSMGFGSAQQDDGSDGRFNFDSTSTPIPSSSSYERRGSGKQRHVFAYDSSMGSVDQSNTSLSSAMGTNMTSMSDHSTSNGLGTPEEKVYSDAGAEGVLPLPAGGLQPLAEEEDEAEEVRAEGSEAEVQPAHVRTVSTFDLEAAGADSYEEDQEDDVEAAEEATYHAAPVSGLPCALSKTPIVSLEGKALSLASSQSGASTQSARSSGSSLQTPGPTSLGDFDDERRHPADVTSDEEDYFEDVEQGQRDLEQDFDDVEALNAQADAHDGVSDDECEDYIGPYSRERKDRPEFIREWSFQEALQSVRHHGGRGAGNGNGKGALSSKRRAQRPPSVDDFFGLMLCEQLDPLPPLPTTHSSLEMPPVYVESLFDVESPAYSPAAGHHQGRSSTSSATGGVTARHAAVTGFKGRPPVARSAYTRDSMSSSVESSVPARGAVVPKARGGSMGMAAAAAASSMVGGGSRALSRVSLQGLTSAFSGLGGYLAGSSGAAVHAAAAASTMCNGRDELDSRNPSISIAHVQRRREDGEGEDETEADDDAAAYYGSAPHTPSAMLQSMPGMMMGGAKRFSGAVAGPAPRSSIPAPPRRSAPRTHRPPSNVDSSHHKT